MEIAKKTIVNLIVLGQLEKGKKINCKGKTFVVDDYTKFQGIFRFLRNDDRTSTLDKIEILVNDVKLLHDYYKNEYESGNNKENLLNLRLYIDQGLNGLEKLRETYSDDKTTWASLGFEIEKLKRIRNLIPNITVNKEDKEEFVEAREHAREQARESETEEKTEPEPELDADPEPEPEPDTESKNEGEMFRKNDQYRKVRSRKDVLQDFN